MSASTISNIYTARNTLLAQLNLQGYNTELYEKFGISEINFMIQNSQLDMLLERTIDETVTKMYVRYYMKKMFRPQNIRELVDDLFLNDTIGKGDTVMIVTLDDGNDSIREFIKQLWEEEEIFVINVTIKRLQFNVLSHVIVPEHTIIFDSEIRDMLNTMKITDKELLPEISRFDPVAVSIGMRPGDICKIKRPSKSAVVSYYYRHCVNI